MNAFAQSRNIYHVTGTRSSRSTTKPFRVLDTRTIHRFCNKSLIVLWFTYYLKYISVNNIKNAHCCYTSSFTTINLQHSILNDTTEN